MMLVCALIIILGSVIASSVAEALQYHYCDTFIAGMIALLQTLPEYAFMIVLTLNGHYEYSILSIIGANILLIALGFPIVVFIGYLSGAKGIREDKTLNLMKENSVESIFLAISGAYMIYMGLKGVMDVIDGIILLVLFVIYMFIVTHLPPEVEEEEPHGLAKFFASRKKISAIAIILSIFLIFIPAEYFTDGIIEISKGWLSAALLMAFLVPLVSEMPEKLTAYIAATKNEDLARLGIANFMSSRINNGTLLFSTMVLVVFLNEGKWAIPIEYTIPHLDMLFILAGILSILGALTTIDRRITMLESFLLIILGAVLILSIEYFELMIYAIILSLILGLFIIFNALKDKRFYWLSDLKHTLGLFKKKKQ